MPRIATIGNYPAITVGNTPVLPLPLPTDGGGKGGGTPVIHLTPAQVAGLLPLIPCDTRECREICGDGWKNPVFGELINGSYNPLPSYENDFNTFWIDISLFNANPSATTVVFELEKYFQGQWRGTPFGVLLNNNVFGQLYALGTVPGHPTYAGYSINWGSVLFHAGIGCYRLKAKVRFTTYVQSNITSGGTQASCIFNLPTNQCLVGAMQGTLQTINGNIPATYNLSQLNTGFTEAQNVQYIVNLINAGSYPYTSTYNGGNSFSIFGQNYANNNNITFKLFVSKAGCEVTSTTTLRNGVNPEPVLIPVVNEACLQSPVFDLKQWDCFRAHGTVKFETWLTGLIGDPYTDLKKHNLCGVLLYDSIRTYGYIHYPKSPTYLKNNLKWGSPKDGTIEKVSDEQTQRWQYDSKYLPEYIHTRFGTFAMMSDKLFASDYNINNSDYTIKRKNFIYDSGYEPEHIDKDAYWQRRNKLKVQVFFNRGVQSVTKTLCCPTH